MSSIHPLQKDCDSENPKQFAAWCWAAGIPDPSPVRPMPIPLIGPMLVEGLSEMLWEFGFRHHSDLQEKWIDGAAGLATMATVSNEKPAADPFDQMAEDFLSANNPKLLEAIRKSKPEEREQLLSKLEKSFSELGGLIDKLREV